MPHNISQEAPTRTRKGNKIMMKDKINIVLEEYAVIFL